MKQSKSPSQLKQSKQQIQVQFDPAKYVKEGLTQEDIIKLKEIFDIFDSNKMGYISPVELQRAIVTLGLEKQAENIMSLIQEQKFDPEQNISFEEFLQVFGFQSEITEEKSLLELFNFFDTDRDGAITLEDFQRVTEQVGERYSKNELKEMIEHAKKVKQNDDQNQKNEDQDLKIGFEEFQAVVTKQYKEI